MEPTEKGNSVCSEEKSPDMSQDHWNVIEILHQLQSQGGS